MKNKANFRKAQMNLNFYSQKDYENKSNWTLGENNAKTNPIQTQTNPISSSPITVREAGRKRGIKTFSGSQPPERIYYCLWEIPV